MTARIDDTILTLTNGSPDMADNRGCVKPPSTTILGVHIDDVSCYLDVTYHPKSEVGIRLRIRAVLKR